LSEVLRPLSSDLRPEQQLVTHAPGECVQRDVGLIEKVTAQRRVAVRRQVDRTTVVHRAAGKTVLVELVVVRQTRPIPDRQAARAHVLHESIARMYSGRRVTQ